MHRRFRIGPPKMHGGFCIGPPKMYRRFYIGPPKTNRWFRIGRPEFFLNLPHYNSAVGELLCTIAIMQENHQNFLFEIEWLFLIKHILKLKG